MAKSYEIAVIGGGPGGYMAALRAARLGKKVMLVEKEYLGGTCLNRGCIPSKTWLKNAEILESMERAKEWGIETPEISVSFGKMKRRKDEVVTRLRNGVSLLLKKGKIDVYEAEGIVEDEHTVKAVSEKGEERIRAEKIIVATGSSPALPPIEGLASVPCYTSDTIFDIESIPASLIIIGGGVIGVEMATVFAALKTKVTIIEAAERIIPAEDAEAAETLAKALKGKGVKIITKATVKRLTKEGESVIAECADGQGNPLIVTGDAVLISVGRKPNLSAVRTIGLEMNGPFIKVNERMETSVPHIYAVGDVIGGYQLAHAAYMEGIVAASNAAGLDKRMDDKVVPRCIFTMPEVAGVGLTEEAAAKAGLRVKTAKFDLAGNGKALISGDTGGFVKIVYEEKFGEILGVTMVGPHVTEMISEASSFISLEGTVEEMAGMIHPHPTISEAFFDAAWKIFE
ncbi:dihydrolipoyl dehydrogenase [Caldibacillus debilis]|uniref:Dihydrolipoyl dehydrogenase n=2 Tax=Caldibacillus debilis TaxID=301148 RepID=A0A420VHM1_9BACI|nr:dihydrolipoyl dehydrogenase [Caldibacillus debilis]KYD21921.1 Dihydrolipoamide dehydrogenase [Caldibacillus debilis]RKO62908.1 dihydrolipoamide dehydrogenase [Caldibacillus debilis GB1]